MKENPAINTTHVLAPLITELRRLIQSARRTAATTVNTLQVLTNFEIGRRIVEHEQKGAERAAYGAELLKEISARLTEEFGKGFSVSSLQLMRKFFIENQERIQQKPSVKSHFTELSQTGTELMPTVAIARNLSGQSGKAPFTLSWSHYVLLLCKRKKQAIVELTLPADANIHAREYSIYLPSKELLQQKLMDWVREREMVYGA